MSFTQISSVGLSAIIGFVLWRAVFKPKAAYPPGPYRWPIVGNVFEVAKVQPWLQFTAWKKQYGDLVYLRIFGRSILVLNSIEAVQELFERRSSTYSDRPKRVMGELCGFGPTLILRNNDSVVREMRKMLHSEMNPRTVRQHDNIVQDAARVLCKSNIEKPEEFARHIRHYVVSLIMLITYGHVVDGENDEFVAMAREVMGNFSIALDPNRFLVDALPFLRYIPGLEFQRIAAAARIALDRFMNIPFSAALARVEAQNSFPSLISNTLTSATKKVDLEHLKSAAGEMYGAGSETNFSIISTFYLAMIFNPEVQKKAQAEILSVLGPGRIPTVADRPNLPYVNAVMEECLRWQPPFPSAGHALYTDDVYRGFFIPSGTLVVANQWGLTHEEKYYPEPDTFNPERFVPSEGKEIPPFASTLVFGFGRRSCPGIHLAINTIFVAISTTLATSDILPEIDEKGKPLLPSGEYAKTGGLNTPLPFKCRIVQRELTI
ncbi:cytochrome P450 [Mycena floridula]|nr:cytochrome P450 [Mycena floridula]